MFNIVEEVKNRNAFHWGAILRSRFSVGNSPGWIKPGHWDMMYVIFNWYFIICFYVCMFSFLLPDFHQDCFIFFLWFHRLHFCRDGTVRCFWKFSFWHFMTLVVNLLVTNTVHDNVCNFLWFADKPSNTSNKLKLLLFFLK